jgi:Asp/Glu/hydantoin racemase
MTPRISLIHATPLAIAPVAESFARLWPQATVFNLLDDSLTADLKAAAGNIGAMTPRFSALAHYAVQFGAHGVLFTCSAFGPAIESVRAGMKVPVLKPNEAMIDDAILRGAKIALVATFEPALAPIAEEFAVSARSARREIDLRTFHVEHAFAALQAGDQATHDGLIAQACAQASDRDVVCFAQFSMTGARDAAERACGRPVLTTPDSAVNRLRQSLKQSIRR